MKLPQIQIQQTNAQLGITISEPQHRIDYQPVDMTIQQPPLDVSIQVDEGRIEIDQTQLRADLGLYTFEQLARNAAQKGEQVVLQGIKRRASDGLQLADITNGNNAVPAIIKSRNKGLQQKQTGITFIPSPNSVKLAHIPADVQIDIKASLPKIDFKAHKPINHYTPGKVTFDLIQKPSIEIDFQI